MRILYHHRTQAEDAQGIHIYEMVKAFRDLGHEVDIVSLVEHDQAEGKEKHGGWWGWLARCAPNWLYEPMALAYNLPGYINLSRQIQLRRPDLIYERYSLNTFCGIWASLRFNIPLVLEVNLPLFYEHNQFGRLLFKTLACFSERWICSHSTWTVVVSKAMKEYFVQQGVPEEKMIIMSNGVDIQRFHMGVSGRMVRQRHHLKGQVVIGFVGWFREWHGLDMLLELFHEANLADFGARLLLVGDGPAAPALHRYVREHHLTEQVIFTGGLKRQEIPSHIAAMDIAILPRTNAYGCPMKVLEYMAMGKCILAPDQATIREILDHGATGFFFKPEDKESLKSILLMLVKDPYTRLAVGPRAHAAVVERGFLWRCNAQKTLELAFGQETNSASNRSC